MTTTLVTGASGMIGAAVVRALLGRGRPVRAICRRAGMAIPPGVELAIVADGEGFDAAMQGMDAVVHCAGALSTASAFSAGGPLAEPDGNQRLTRAVVRAARNAGVSRFVFMSSVAVYGPGNGVPIGEDREERPVSDYGWSKLAMEREVTTMARGAMQAMILRPSIVTGPGDRHFRRSLDRMAKLPLFVAPRRSAAFDIAHCDDIAELAILALERGAHGRAYNATSDFSIDLPTLARLVARRRPLVQVSEDLFRAGVAALRPVLAPFSADAKALLGPVAMAYLFEGGGRFSIERARSELGFAPPLRQWAALVTPP